MKINILTKFHDVWIKTVPTRVYTSFFQYLTQWPSFQPDLTQFQMVKIK